MYKLLTLFFSLSIPFLAQSQQLELKYGKVTQEELEMTQCDFYPEAESMILGESGDLRLMYYDERGWTYVINITKRIKIFSYQDKDLANIRLRFYDPEGGKSHESIYNIKATTYNLVNGKIEKTKLTNKEEHETRISDYRKEISFAMPDVNEGSVIEYQYTIKSDFYYNLYTWHFQNNIPTLRSEFRYTLPEFFNYSANQVGNIYPTERLENTQPEIFTYTYETTPQQGARVERGKGSIKSQSKRVVMVAKNIPPVLDEPFQNNKKNIPYRLEFQLISTNMPGSPTRMVAESYEDFNKTMLKSSGVGVVVNKGFFFRNMVEELEGWHLEKAKAIYEIMQENFVYNNVISSYSTKAGKQAFNDKEGSSSDINLTLVAALREAGIDANPILLSTRGHGIPHPVYPNFDEFNYVIASAKIDEKLYLLDATTDLPFGNLPTRCLNDKGWMVNEPVGEWVDLKANASYNVTLLSSTSIAEGMMQTKHDVKYENYAFFSESDDFKEDEESYYTDIQNSFPDSEVLENNVETGDSDLKVHVQVEKELDNESVIYIQPIAFEAVKSNPFKREERLAPIDFPYTVSRKLMANFEVPEGYSVELPEPTIVKLPEGTAKFTYTARQQGDQIMVMSIFELNKNVFTSTEYPMLKQFYDLVAKKHGEMIVLKKI